MNREGGEKGLISAAGPGECFRERITGREHVKGTVGLGIGRSMGLYRSLSPPEPDPPGLGLLLGVLGKGLGGWSM